MSDFESQEIEYSFVLPDIAGRAGESRVRKIGVDTIPPVIESFDYSINGKKVTLTIQADEENLGKIEYIDNMETNPKYKNLCTSLTFGFCEKTKIFKTGHHDIDIRAVDEAGNTAMVIEGLEFDIF